MKRIIYSLVLMFAASGLFTACIDNVEPVGVQDMRNAHAEYLRACAKLKQADAQVQQAQVTFVEAQAALELAKADYQKALAEIAKAKNDADIAAQKAATDMAQARLELEKAKAALENAYLQAQIDAYSAKAAAELQAYIDSMNAVVAGLQNENERAAAELEIAKKQAELDSLAAVAELEYQVAKWQAELDSLATVQDVADAEAAAKIDSINKAMEISAIQHEQALAQATEALRQTLAEIEVGKLTLTPDESASMEMIVSSYNEALLWYEQAWNELQDYYQEAAQAAAFTETRMPVVLAKAERELNNLEKRTGKLYAEIELWTNIKNDVVDVMVAQLAAYQDTVQQWKDAVTNILAQKCFVKANEIPAIDAARVAAKKEADEAYEAALKELKAPAKVKYNKNNGSKKEDTKDEDNEEAKWLEGKAPAMKVGGPSEKDFIASYVTAPKKGEPQKEWSLMKSYDYPEWDAFDPIADFIYQANDFTPFVFTLFGMRLNVVTPAVDCSDDAKFEAAKKLLFTQKASAHNPTLGLRTLIEDIEREYVNDFNVGADIKAARIASTAAYRDSIEALYNSVYA
ncbi:MAG: hypothetical protein HUJ93_07845, partial [Bacteroidales bacterium]|nr:hypothetical protein [Bacteroidales bacterium]